MLLNIENKRNEEIEISFGKEKLRINIKEEDMLERNEEWNTLKINDFLIQLASSMDIEEKIEINEVLNDFDNNIFEHVASLFVAFAEEYNK